MHGLDKNTGIRFKHYEMMNIGAFKNDFIQSKAEPHTDHDDYTMGVLGNHIKIPENLCFMTIRMKINKVLVFLLQFQIDDLPLIIIHRITHRIDSAVNQSL